MLNNRLFAFAIAIVITTVIPFVQKQNAAFKDANK